MRRARTLALALVAALAPAAAAAEPDAQFSLASEPVLANPHDLILSPDGALLYVSDVGNNRIALLDPETLALVGAFGAGELSGPHDVDIGPDGRIYVADTRNGRVAVYAGIGAAARLVASFGEGVSGPEGVLVHPNGRVYVAGAWSDNLVAYEDGAPVAELTGLSSPHDVALAGDGENIWLADAGADRMLLLTPELEIVKELSGAPYDFDGVRYQDVLPGGGLIAADKYSHQVKVIGLAGDDAVDLVIGGPDAGLGPNLFRTPEGVEIGGELLYLSDSGNDRVVLYRLRLD
jgi:DNA-binding beta-propeller fold protein YncE